MKLSVFRVIEVASTKAQVSTLYLHPHPSLKFHIIHLSVNIQADLDWKKVAWHEYELFFEITH